MAWSDQWRGAWRDLAKAVTGDSAQRGPTIRVMTRRDLDEVLRIIRLHDSDDYKAARAAFDESRFELPPDVSAHFVIEEPDERRIVGVCGYFIGDNETRGTYWLGWTYINPFFRGRGYGGVLMDFVLAGLSQLGARKIFLTTSSLPKYQSAVGFYKKHGFVEEGRLLDYYNDGEHQLIMGCPLQGAGRRVAPRSSSIKPAPNSRAPSQPAPPPRSDNPKDDDDDGVVFEF